MHLLIVEDDRTIAENLYDYLEARGHQCDYAGSIAAASALLARSAFDALVLDHGSQVGVVLAFQQIGAVQADLGVSARMSNPRLDPLAARAGGQDRLGVARLGRAV